MSNPYEAPDADIRAPGEEAEYEPKIFSLNGRIGRARYVAWGFIINLVAMIPLGIIMALVMPGMADGSGGASALLIIPAYIIVIFASFVMARRRLHDLNRTSWLFVAFIIPLVNLLLVLYLLLWPGTLGSNNYGPPPVKNTTVVWAILIGGIVLSGVFFALAWPAYTEFIEAAAEAAASS